jgi:hypothetical protein
LIACPIRVGNPLQICARLAYMIQDTARRQGTTLSI